MKTNNTLIIDNIKVAIEGEKNLLELVRKAKIELPTFCYLSEMSVYGACRLCIVDIEGRGLQPACSTTPAPNMIVKTNTKELRNMRKMIVELLLASHNGECPTCSKGADCQLKELAQRTGVSTIRFNRNTVKKPIDNSSIALLRDPNKCVLCGDCVRMCNEIQGVNAIDFAYRGSSVEVTPCFNKGLGEIECVNCGQCARVCPTGAIVPKPNIEDVWDALQDKSKYVVAQIAPAVRVALGEAFGMKAGTLTIGNIVAALRRMGFDKIYDTSFTADLTIFEEATEFIGRFTKGEKLPLFTSCCPAWVKFAEQYYPDYLPNISSCRSPQQMLGSIVKNSIASSDKVQAKDIVMVSIMPCTAKKAEAARDEFNNDYGRDVDYVITTSELIQMINEMGLNFNNLELESFDMPYGFKTGAGVIFGNSGGVTEAVVRYAGEKLTGIKSEDFIVTPVRGEDGIREYTANIGEHSIRIAIVSGLSNAKKVMEWIRTGKKKYDFIEVMACPGGCINGGGQPTYTDLSVKLRRKNALYENDLMLQLHKPQENPYVENLYQNKLEYPNSHTAHTLLHTSYKSQKRTGGDDVSLSENAKANALDISLCFGTSCFLKGAQKLLKELTDYIDENKLKQDVNIKATFCLERCDKGPVIRVGDTIIEQCTLEKAAREITNQLGT